MADSAPADLAPIRERLKDIIRRDLKLGDVPIADDMSFLHSQADLDSLDMLLLVTSIEREFGIKIPSEQVGQAIFENVSTLASYIHERSRGQQNPPGAPAPQASVDPLQRLPHQEPFRFITGVTQLREGESAEGVWSVSGSEAFFDGHFPGRPIVPGVLIAEALAQLSGLITGGAVASSPHGKLAHVDVRFEQPVAPPARIVLRSRFVRHVGQLRQFDVSATVENAVVARGSLALHFESAPDAGDAVQP